MKSPSEKARRVSESLGLDAEREQIGAEYVPCECAARGRDNVGGLLFLSHHPTCKMYRPEPEIRRLLDDLISGIEAWAADEDGVHPELWHAYRKACGVCGVCGAKNCGTHPVYANDAITGVSPVHGEVGKEREVEG